MKRKKKSDTEYLVEGAWARVREIELRIRALEMAVRDIRRYDATCNASKGYELVSDALHTRLARAQQDLFALGHLTKSPTQRRAIAKLAFKKLFGEDLERTYIPDFVLNMSTADVKETLKALAKQLFEPDEITAIPELAARRAASDAWEIRQLEMESSDVSEPDS